MHKRVGIAAGSAVAIAVLIAALIAYFVVRGQLIGQVDGALKAQATAAHDFHSLGAGFPDIPASAGGPAPYVQVVTADGRVLLIRGNIQLPIDSHTQAVAEGNAGAYLTDAQVGSAHLRELTFPVNLVGNFGQSQPAAVELARPLNAVDHVLANLRLILFLVFVGGIALAAALGRLAASRVLAPLAEVAQTASYIGETDDLSRRLQIHADDEVGQLATRFNTMLDHLESSRNALDDSVRAQRQLIADASHELRTPVTSLRTNIEVLLAGGELSPEERRRLLADVVEQSEELSALVSDLIELGRGDQPQENAEDFRVDRVVEQALARARRNSPGLRFVAQLEPRVLEGMPDRLERAVNNLLDNASRHSPPGGAVEVTVDSQGIRVRDHGSGVAEVDLPHVFDRFYRGSSMRGQQGSGLGLSIVRQVTEQHGGAVAAHNAPDGGAVFEMRLPLSAPADEPEPTAHDRARAPEPEPGHEPGLGSATRDPARSRG